MSETVHTLGCRVRSVQHWIHWDVVFFFLAVHKHGLSSFC